MNYKIKIGNYNYTLKNSFPNKWFYPSTFIAIIYLNPLTFPSKTNEEKNHGEHISGSVVK